MPPCCTWTKLTSKPDSVVVVLSDVVTVVPLVALVTFVVAATVELVAGVEVVVFRDSAVVLVGDEVMFTDVVLCCAGVTFGPTVVNCSRKHTSSSSTTAFFPF